MKLEYQITFNECLAAYKANLKFKNFIFFSPLFRWGLSIFLICLSLTSIFWFDYFAIELILPAVIICPFVSGRIGRLLVRFKWNENKHLNSIVTVDIDSEKIKFTSVNSIVETKWDVFLCFIEHSNLFLIYQNSIIYIIVPKRAFADKEELDSFRNILIDKVNSNPNRKKIIASNKRRKIYHVVWCLAFFCVVFAILIPAKLMRQQKLVDWYSSEGNYFYSEEMYKEALVYYDRVLEIDPKYVKAWINRGLTLYELKRYEEALYSYDKALEIAPNNQFLLKKRKELWTELSR